MSDDNVELFPGLNPSDQLRFTPGTLVKVRSQNDNLGRVFMARANTILSADHDGATIVNYRDIEVRLVPKSASNPNADIKPDVEVGSWMSVDRFQIEPVSETILEETPKFETVEEAQAWLDERGNSSAWTEQVESFANTATTASLRVQVDCSNCGCSYCFATSHVAGGRPMHTAVDPSCRCAQTGCKCLM